MTEPKYREYLKPIHKQEKRIRLKIIIEQLKAIEDNEWEPNKELLDIRHKLEKEV